MSIPTGMGPACAKNVTREGAKNFDSSKNYIKISLAFLVLTIKMYVVRGFEMKVLGSKLYGKYVCIYYLCYNVCV